MRGFKGLDAPYPPSPVNGALRAARSTHEKRPGVAAEAFSVSIGQAGIR
jgi:hypothetical protein